MTEQTTDAGETSTDTDAREPETLWVTPDFVEQSACAEICAYVFAD